MNQIRAWMTLCESASHQHSGSSDREVCESAPPGKKAEAWIKANKARFRKEYGAKRYKSFLYGHAWKVFGKKHHKEACELRSYLTLVERTARRKGV